MDFPLPFLVCFKKSNKRFKKSNKQISLHIQCIFGIFAEYAELNLQADVSILMCDK